jgi:hypothetical protein
VSYVSDASRAFYNTTTFNIAALKLNVIVLAVVFAPPLPVIIRVGLTASSTKLPLAIKLVNKSVVYVVGNTNTTIAKNTTTISNLKDQIDIKTDLTHWDVSHASDAQKAST